MKSAVEFYHEEMLEMERKWQMGNLNFGQWKEMADEALRKAKEMEKEQKIAFAKLHVQKALKAVENEMTLSASAVKHWYLPETIK